MLDEANDDIMTLYPETSVEQDMPTEEGPGSIQDVSTDVEGGRVIYKIHSLFL